MTSIVQHLVDTLDDMDCDACYVLPAEHCTEQFGQYWADLERANLLQMRFHSIDNVTASMATTFLKVENIYYYAVLRGVNMIAEFALSDFTGRAAQAHFSFHPTLTTKEMRWLGVALPDMVLNHWYRNGTPFIETLYGITPTLNKAACRYVKAVGWTPLGVLPSGSQYLTKTSDSLITYKARRHDG